LNFDRNERGADPMAKILKVNPVNPEIESIKEAAAIIKGGGIVVFPTETVYGIGADAFDADACTKIFQIKHRPADNPLIVHISKIGQLGEVADDVSDDFLKVAKILWPGPVTFILKANPRLPGIVTGGLETVAVRMPAHPIALRLIDESGPIAAPSANISKRPSGTKAEHAIKELGSSVDLIIDGGPSAFGIESTIINMCVKPCVLLRPGAFTIEELGRYLGEIRVPESMNLTMGESERPLAPGMKYRHYAPGCRLAVAASDELLLSIADRAKGNKDIAFLCSDEIADKMGNGAITVRLGSERSLYEIGKNLFDSLRKLDSMNVRSAIIQSFPERGIGLAIMNRIMKASGSNVISSLSDFGPFTYGLG
jgi:L-threonylcarbamoyladenylate synthase